MILSFFATVQILIVLSIFQHQIDWSSRSIVNFPGGITRAMPCPANIFAPTI